MTATAHSKARIRKPKSKSRLAYFRRVAKEQHAEQRRMLESLPKRTDEQIAAWLVQLRALRAAQDLARCAHLSFSTYETKAALEFAARALEAHRRAGCI